MIATTLSMHLRHGQLRAGRTNRWTRLRTNLPKLGEPEQVLAGGRTDGRDRLDGAAILRGIQKPQEQPQAAREWRQWRLRKTQGELFRAGRKQSLDLRVNEHGLGDRKRADLSCGDPPTMLAEIKIVGSWYFPKMQFAIESDVERMRRASAPDAERYMILVIPEWPETDGKTALGRYLDTCKFSDKCTERRWAGFHLKIWRL